MHSYEIRLRKDKRGVDLISDAVWRGDARASARVARGEIEEPVVQPNLRVCPK